LHKASQKGRTQVNFRCLAGLLIAGAPSVFSNSAGLNPETLNAWNDYIHLIEARTPVAPGGSGHFLWSDHDPQLAGRLQQGEIPAAPGTEGNGMRAVPHGLIHDWVGAVFIPGVTLAQVFAVLDDYGRYNQLYGPTVVDAELLCRTKQSSAEDDDRFRVRYAQKTLFMSELVDIEYDARRIRLDDRRWYSITQSTRLDEFHRRGSSDKVVTADEVSPYVWRIYCISKYEQRDGGVYMEQENIALSRGIPISLRWLIEPAVRQLSRDLTTKSLRQTREAVLSVTQHRTPPPSPIKSGS
jgi:hypothetical protein